MEHNKAYRYFMDLSFEGTSYHGWQVQPNAISIQQMLSQTLQVLLKEDAELVGCGRTDTGVHAIHYTAHFSSRSALAAMDPGQLVYKLNRILPHDIAIKSIRRVHDEAHARFSALSRSYAYYISRKKDPFMINRAWLMERPLDFDVMQQAAQILLQYNDFESFTKSNVQLNSYLCELTEARWQQEDDVWIFHISGNRFLRNMVRAIVGTLTDVGLGKTTLEQLHAIIKSKKRSRAGYSVPGHGLYFIGATYPENIYVQDE